ncbi:MAG: SelB C-terminal domain-containing protein, partial [Paraburkholderia sp.]
ELALLAYAGITLQHWSPLHVHIGTTHRVAHVALLDRDILSAGEAGRVQLVFDAPVCALPGDRFIVRNAQASRTVGGGRVLDPFGPARKRRTPERLAWLDALRAWLDEGTTEPLLEQAPRGMLRSTLMHLTGLPASLLSVPDTALTIALHGKTADDAVIILRRQWDHLAAQIVTTLQQFHERMPDEQGPDAARLRRMAAPLLAEGVWRALIDALAAEGALMRSGAWLHLPEHSVSLDPGEEALAATLLPLIAQGRFDPPWVRDLASATQTPEEKVRQLLRKLARQGAVYQVVRDLFYHPDTVRELARLVASLAQEQGGVLGASVFRDASGLGRKRAIQILEFFDRVGYTRFQRDLRFVRTDSRLIEGL